MRQQAVVGRLACELTTIKPAHLLPNVRLGGYPSVSGFTTTVIAGPAQSTRSEKKWHLPGRIWLAFSAAVAKQSIAVLELYGTAALHIFGLNTFGALHTALLPSM